MAIAMPSRFAVLKIEDDDFQPAHPNKTKDKKKIDQKQNIKKSDKSGTGTTKKSGKQQQQPPKSQSQQKKDKKRKESSEQWEQWKQKDSELVEGTFEEDLHTAILQSKLDYEEKKVMYKQNKKEAEQEKKTNDIQNIKKKKTKTMSLEQFKNMVSNDQKPNAAIEEDEDSFASPDDDKFFDRLRSETKEEMHKELSKDLIKEVKKDKVRKSFNNDTITIAQLQEKISFVEIENTKLKAELEKAKKEILSVKRRNKTLCGILGSGEMKDKADILMELEKHTRIKDELSEEVIRLNGLLEQERSRSKSSVTAIESHSSHKDKHSKEHKEKHRKKGKD